MILSSLFEDIRKYIDENYEEPCEMLFSPAINESAAKKKKKRIVVRHNSSVLEDDFALYNFCMPKSLKFEVQEKTFTEMLLHLIDKSGKKDSEIYKKANIDRKLFSKIRSDVNYQPSKKTAICLCLALELDIDSTLDLLQKAGYALSRSNKGDLIIRYFIEHSVHDLMQINQVLVEFDQPILNY